MTIQERILKRENLLRDLKIYKNKLENMLRKVDERISSQNIAIKNLKDKNSKIEYDRKMNPKIIQDI